MATRINKLDLLDFVEGTIEPRRADQVRRVLEKRPALRRRVEGMIEDRDANRIAAIPTLARDLVADVMAGRSAGYDLRTEDAAPFRAVPTGPRRRGPVAPPTAVWIRQGWSGAYMKWTVAAAVLGAVAIGVRYGLVGIDRVTPNDDALLAGDSAASPAPGAGSSAQGTMRVPSADELLATNAVVHHGVPRPVVGPLRGLADAVAAGGGGGVKTVIASEDGTVGAAALVIEASDAAAVVEHLRAAVERLGGDVALVRNFTYDDALALERRLVDREVDGRLPRPALGDLRPSGAAGALDERGQRVVVDWIRRVGAVEPSSVDEHLGEQLAGPRSAAPSPAIQLDLAEHGFSYAMTIPASRLDEVLAAIAEPPASGAWISPRFNERGDRIQAAQSGTGSASVAVFERWRRWSEAVRSIGVVDDAGDVLLPIAIRVPARHGGR